LEYTTGDSLASKQAIETVISVGAISALASPWETIEPYSSHGPSTIYTDLGPAQDKGQRDSLDLCGIDGVQTKIGQLDHFSNPFFGTSAAAPHIAGIAALLLQIDPNLTPAEIQDLITGNAVDIGASGYDGVSGWGRADALATITAAANAADLKAASDTGTSSTDDLTKLDNSAPGKKLQFDVTGTLADATVTIYAGETAIGSAVATTSTTTVTTDGEYDLTDTGHSITARQTEDGKLESPATSALTVTVDTQAPTVDIQNVSPDPRGTAVTSIEINFSEEIDPAQFTLADLGLTRDGPAVSLATADLTDDGNHEDWTLAGLASLTAKVGKYKLTLTASGSGITDVAGNSLAADADDEWLMHTINGTGGDDTISLQRSGSLTQVSVNSDPTYTFDMSNLSLLYVVTDAGDDELTIDFGAGNPLPGSGLNYDGGAGELLQILGTTGNDAVTLTSTEATVNGAAIAYTSATNRAVAVELGDEDDTITVNSGTFLFTTDVGPGTDELTVTLTLNNSAAVTFDASQHLAALNLNNNSTATLTAGINKVLVTKELTIEGGDDPTGLLDLSDNYLVVDYDGTLDDSPLNTIRIWIAAAFDGGTWLGKGINASAVQSDTGLYSVGYAENVLNNNQTEFGGVTVDETSVLVRYTYSADIDLDGFVLLSDAVIMGTYFDFGATDGHHWYEGDLDYDGYIGISDAVILGTYYPQEHEL
jgi:hypothetical protein